MAEEKANTAVPLSPVPVEPTAKEARAALRLEQQRAATTLHTAMVRCLSPIRLAAFEDSSGGENSASWIIGRYWYSVAFGEQLYPALHYLEVALRNALYEAIATRFATPNGVDVPDCWLDWPRTATVLHQDQAEQWRDDVEKVEHAKRLIARDGRVVDQGRLIAELSFGFWVGLFAGHYGGRAGDTDPRKLWPDLLPVVFPDLPEDMRKRAVVADRLQQIRLLRNRAYHHEPLWRRKVQGDAKLIIETIGWIDPTIAAMASNATKAAATHLHQGIGDYEKRAREYAHGALGE